MNPSLSIDVYVDFICPWCLIGKRQLQRALAQLREAPWTDVLAAAHAPGPHTALPSPRPTHRTTMPSTLPRRLPLKQLSMQNKDSADRTE